MRTRKGLGKSKQTHKERKSVEQRKEVCFYYPKSHASTVCPNLKTNAKESDECCSRFPYRLRIAGTTKKNFLTEQLRLLFTLSEVCFAQEVKESKVKKLKSRPVWLFFNFKKVLLVAYPPPPKCSNGPPFIPRCISVYTDRIPLVIFMDSCMLLSHLWIRYTASFFSSFLFKVFSRKVILDWSYNYQHDIICQQVIPEQ